MTVKHEATDEFAQVVCKCNLTPRAFGGESESFDSDIVGGSAEDTRRGRHCRLSCFCLKIYSTEKKIKLEFNMIDLSNLFVYLFAKVNIFSSRLLTVVCCSRSEARYILSCFEYLTDGFS